MTLTHSDTHADFVITWNETGPAPLRGIVVVFAGRGESPDVYERFGRRLAVDAYRVHILAAASDNPARTSEQLVQVLSDAPPTLPRVVAGSDGGAAYAAYLAAIGELADISGLILAGLPTATTSASQPSRDAVGWDAELDLRTSCPAHRSRISDHGVRPAQLFEALPQAWLDPSIPERITIPMLGIHGAADQISPLALARDWYRRAPRAELVSIVGGHHDVLNDQTHRSVAASIVLYLERLRASAELTPIVVTETLG